MMHQTISYYGFSAHAIRPDLAPRTACIATARAQQRSPASAGASPFHHIGTSSAGSRRAPAQGQINPVRRTNEPGSRRRTVIYLPDHRRRQGASTLTIVACGSASDLTCPPATTTREEEEETDVLLLLLFIIYYYYYY